MREISGGNGPVYTHLSKEVYSTANLRFRKGEQKSRDQRDSVSLGKRVDLYGTYWIMFVSELSGGGKGSDKHEKEPIRKKKKNNDLCVGGCFAGEDRPGWLGGGRECKDAVSNEKKRLSHPLYS